MPGQSSKVKRKWQSLLGVSSLIREEIGVWGRGKASAHC